MQPKFLFVKLHRMMRVAKKETVFDQDDARGAQFQSGVFGKQLVRKNEQVHDNDSAVVWWVDVKKFELAVACFGSLILKIRF